MKKTEALFTYIAAKRDAGSVDQNKLALIRSQFGLNSPDPTAALTTFVGPGNYVVTTVDGPAGDPAAIRELIQRPVKFSAVMAFVHLKRANRNSFGIATKKGAAR